MRDYRNEPTIEPQDKPKAPNRVMRQKLAQMTLGTSPVSTMNLVHDWALHLAAAPDKQLSLMHKAQDNWLQWMTFLSAGCPADAQPVTPPKTDHRFQHDAWSRAPFAALSQAFLLAEDFVDHATSDVPGLQPERDKAMTFVARQMLDTFAPSNFLLTNPEALARTAETKGANLLHGYQAFVRDAQAALTETPERPSKRPGKELARAKGKVVLRTHLMELIQYAPTTDTVHPEPVLIVPAWIMKYYILDLSPENSMVRYLTSQGFTVFMISWRNPDAADADLGMQDYLEQGPLTALDHISQVNQGAKIHATGYCLGGSLLSITAAKLARDGDERLASLTLLAAQTDFTEAGELMVFINESQVSFLEDLMQEQGYLDAGQMTSAFQMLRSNDLIWSRLVHGYLMGEDPAPMNDLMAWNADSTRMPARMHREYLRGMYLNNDLASGRYMVDGHPVSLRDIRVPIFVVGTETDHIAPWQSVYKIHNLTHADVTFALTNGGHNAGVVSKPGHPRRRFKLLTRRDAEPALSPDDWLNAAAQHDGSWWLAWSGWLGERSGPQVNLLPMGKSLGDAPGTYVMMP